MAASATSHLLKRLARSLGRGTDALEDARRELRWMKQALHSPPKGIKPDAKSLEEMVERRVRNEPIQYILGSVPFGTRLELACRRPVLIPRPETEDWALKLASVLRAQASPARPLRILDLCTGTGCIPLLLCAELPPGSVRATGVDISEAAVQLSAENARINGIAVSGGPGLAPAKNDKQENTFTPVLADLMDPDFVNRAGLEPPYDVITSNPPYIPLTEYEALDSSVRDWEDPRALLGDPVSSSPAAPSVPDAHLNKGLAFYHRIAALVRGHGLLAPDGWLALEVGDGQAEEVGEIVRRGTALRAVATWEDPYGKRRAVVARREGVCEEPSHY
ncbi:S-adenosyl-L-methionine-dependent methyltransferase [Trametes coccinea BRFM310]|uniref:S-adenosyl-L-methionine-dependent methyltransferase n=1 Tax=Trametes coccinea (strain BRFM310) TaxID=1353009 RepID=A0A1Y2J201_TRAC3|nr:S-adenosyl-L-methionine-dependent methyltransferase [Trametes coccinea BRFM310]